jgi:hypothetical protein
VNEQEQIFVTIVISQLLDGVSYEQQEQIMPE